MHISDWSSDVCSSDLIGTAVGGMHGAGLPRHRSRPLSAAATTAVTSDTPARAHRGIESAGFLPMASPMTKKPDRKSVVEGRSVSVRVDLGGRRTIKKKNTQSCTSLHTHQTHNN